MESRRKLLKVRLMIYNHVPNRSGFMVVLCSIFLDIVPRRSCENEIIRDMGGYIWSMSIAAQVKTSVAVVHLRCIAPIIINRCMHACRSILTVSATMMMIFAHLVSARRVLAWRPQ